MLPNLPPGLRLPRPEKPVFAEDGPRRLVFVGDSITDGHTLPLLVRQALADAKKPVPVVINAGVAGDTAAGMRKRLERDVLSRKPTLVLSQRRDQRRAARRQGRGLRGRRRLPSPRRCATRRFRSSS